MPRSLRQNGVALVLVLWVTVLLAIMAGAFTLTLQREAKLLGNLKARSEANALAEAGLYYALLMLSVNDTHSAWQADGNVHELFFNGGVVAVQIGDERGKIDLNYAKRDVLYQMFISLALEMEEADRLTDAILDWRDKNDDVHLNGAEKKQYQQNNLAYAPRNGLFQSVEELHFVLGVTPQIFNAVEPMLTVYSRTSKVDKTKASAEVLRVLGALGEDQSGVNSDRETPQLASETDAEASGDTKKASSASGFYTILSEALLPGGQTAQIRIVARRGSGNSVGFDILNWKYLTAQPKILQSGQQVLDAGYF